MSKSRKILFAVAALVLLLTPSALAQGSSRRVSKRHTVTRRYCLLRRRGHRAVWVRCRVQRRRIRAHISAGARRPTARRPVPGSTTTGVSSDPAAIHCDLYASPSGSDSSGDGSLGAPFATVQKLDESLSPGQTGCLRAGTYGSVNTLHRIDNNGTSSGQITITSYPGETATVVGWVDIEGSYTTVSHLQIDGSNTFYRTQRSDTTCRYPVSQGLVIAGRNDVFEYNNYYQSVPSLRGNGLGIGWWGDVDNTIVRFNKIHDVGGCDFYDHLIYLDSGNNVQIYDNWMWNDAHGWGVKLDPGPTNARVWDNVIDHAASGFGFGNSSGTNPTAGNLVWHNVVMNSSGLSNPDINWSHPGVLVSSPGLLSNSTGNQVHDNVSYDNPGGVASLSQVTSQQLAVADNATSNPQLANPSSQDYAPESSSPAASWGLWNGK